MDNFDQLSFSVRDRIGDIDVSPSHAPLSLIGEFQKDVSDFLRGASRDVKTSEVMISVEHGSLGFAASGLIALAALWGDVAHLASSTSLAHIDKTRAKVLERWQLRARENPNRNYFISNKSAGIAIRIDSNSNYQQEQNIWLHVEKYITGIVIDMGGASKPNIHFKLPSGELITVSAKHSQIEGENLNRVFHTALLHVTAEENLISGQLRNLRLLNFENYQPQYDESQFQKMVASGSLAWADVESPAAWVDELRGNN